jgi:hypothetical protein
MLESLETYQLDILIDKYVPLHGSSYIPLPNFLADKTAIINVKNKDDEVGSHNHSHLLYIQQKTMWIE